MLKVACRAEYPVVDGTARNGCLPSGPTVPSEHLCGWRPSARYMASSVISRPFFMKPTMSSARAGAIGQVGGLSATGRQVAMRHDLMRAMAQGQLRLEYQPIGRVGDGRVIGAEALVRREHPSRGLVTPEIVMPLTDRSAHCVSPGYGCSSKHALTDIVGAKASLWERL
jgi:EAL domain-containing protein